MTLTHEQAVDDIQKILNEAWTPTGYKIFFESVKNDQDYGNDPFIRSWIRHTVSDQATLGGMDNRLFSRNGFLRIEVYTPITNGLQESYQLAKVIADAYEGRSSDNGVWFRRTRVTEIGKDGNFNRLDVIVEFQYHEIK